MPAAHLRARACSLLRTIACVAVSLTAAWLIAAATPADATCTNGGGSNCLPQSGYTTDEIWSCSVNTAPCYHDSTTSAGSATFTDWGWGSADYSGTGSVYVCVQGAYGRTEYFTGCAYGLARACATLTCDDQDSFLMLLAVLNQSGVTHTINGHGKG